MSALDETRSEQGRRAASRFGGAVVVATVVAACAGENLFTGPADAGGSVGPQVEITAPVPPVNIPPGDSVNVIANITSSAGVTEVTFSGRLVAGGEAPFTPIVIPLAPVNDTTLLRFLKRSGSTPGAAEIIVTATEAGGATGADTVAVNLN